MAAARQMPWVLARARCTHAVTAAATDSQRACTRRQALLPATAYEHHASNLLVYHRCAWGTGSRMHVGLALRARPCC